ncbi:amino acid ABC transporter, partial [Rhizobium johnstonii]
IPQAERLADDLAARGITAILDDEGVPSGGRCVADMFADHEAERRRSA